jgi:hypothetical protein
MSLSSAADENIEDDRRTDRPHPCCGRRRRGAQPWLFPCLGGAGLARPRAYLLSGILLFVADLAIVRTHNIWAGGWPVLVTVLGWLILLGGLARMLFPTQIAAIAAGVGRSTGVIVAAAIVLLVLGAILLFKGYSRD